ncbi:chemotaxis protein CheW [Ekhidna sp.]
MALGKNLKKTEQDVASTSEEKESASNATDHSNVQIVENSSDEKSEVKQFCVFKSGAEKYAIPIHFVKEVVKIPPIAPVPQMPKYIIGMSNIRGNIYGVLDIKIFFNNESSKIDGTNYLLVIEHEEFKMAIIIPEVPDTLLIAEDMIEQLSASGIKSVTGRKYLKGIIRKDNQMIILFDVLGMITGSKFAEISA